MPTTITREDIHIRTLSSGAELRIPVFHVQGEGERPKVYIQANIHGPEIAGIGAIYNLLDLLRAEPRILGNLTIVPSVNPVALNSKVSGQPTGYHDLNEATVGNFNRIYQMPVVDTLADDADSPRKVPLNTFVAEHMDADLETIKRDFRAAIGRALASIDAHRAPYGSNYGHRLASIIQHMAYDADYLIDLHTAGIAAYHLYTFPESMAAARLFDLRYVIQLEGDSFSGVLDESFLQPWLRLRDAFAEAGRDIPFSDFDLEAFTPELGSADTLERQAMHRDAERIMNYLRAKGVLEGEAVVHTDGDFVTCKHAHYRAYHASTGGLLLLHVKLDDRVSKGDPLATIIQPYRKSVNVDGGSETEITMVAAEDGIVINHAQTQIINQYEWICSIMTQVEGF
jgi:uncharacterized protein